MRSLLLLSALSGLYALPAAADVYVVTTTADYPSDGVCYPGNCTLREAIDHANTHPGWDEIYFDIDEPEPHEIELIYELPYVEDTVLIDGTGWDGNPGIGISRSNYPLTIHADDCQIRGLAIWRASVALTVGPLGNRAIIENNWLGINVSNTDGGVAAGIEIIASDDVHVGGPDSSQRNVIAGTMWGINVYNDTFQTNLPNRTVIQGNYIGTDPSGTDRTFSSTLWNKGIEVFDGSRTLIGGDGIGEGNVIGSVSMAIVEHAFATTIAGNSIGVGAGGDPLPNHTTGVTLSGEAAWVWGNEIAYSGASAIPHGWCRHGIVVLGGDWSQNRIRFNSIHDNVGLGIALGDCRATKPLENDFIDMDNGANHLQNHPDILDAYLVPGRTKLQVSLDSETDDMTYGFDFYASPHCDESGYGEGQVYLGTANLTTNIVGVLSPTWVELPVEAPEGWYITATVTAYPDLMFPSWTSEFSECERLDLPPR